MVRRMLFVATLAGVAVMAAAASAAPFGSAALGQAVEPQAAQPVTFWGYPYPYGYRYAHGQCWRHVQVETRRGLRWKRVWVCR